MTVDAKDARQELPWPIEDKIGSSSQISVLIHAFCQDRS